MSLPLDIVMPAFLTGFFVLLSHVPLGREVLKRGIIFIDLAVAQAAATGALLAASLGHIDNGLILELAAGTTALVTAAFLHQLEKHCPDIQEPIIGCTFVVLACLAILLLASDPHGGEHFSSLLSGEILWSNTQSISYLALASLFAIGCFYFFNNALLGFYLPFAIAITASVQSIGVYLVFASLILPSIAVWTIQGWRGIGLGLLIGLAAYSLGLFTSVWLNMPTGPCIVLSLAVCALIAAGIKWFVMRNCRI